MILIISGLIFLIYFVMNGYKTRIYKPNVPLLLLLLGFLIFFHFEEKRKSPVVVLMFVLLMLYFTFLIFKRSIRTCKLSYLYYRINKYLDLTAKEISGLRVSVFVSLLQLFDMLLLLTIFIVLYHYLEHDHMDKTFILDHDRPIIFGFALSNIACKIYTFIWVLKNFNQIHERGTGYFFSENRRNLFNSFRLYDNVKFTINVQGNEFKKKVVLNPEEFDIDLNHSTVTFPDKCSICKSRAPVFISRPCNHVIMCRSCQKLRMNQFTNCWACFKAVNYLWKFRLEKGKRRVEIRKVIEVRRKLNLTID
jgi:hypothetical protein